jgi:sugar phosphate isomerase/epimerase
MLLSLSGFLFDSENPAEHLPFADFCELAAASGYGGVELRQKSQVNPQTPKAERCEMLRMVKDHGLVVTCLTARNMPQSGRERDNFFAGYLELCTDMECRLMKITSDPEWAHRAAARAQEFGIALASNNHVGGPAETVAGTRRFLGAINHPNWGLLYDCMHLRLTGQDYLGCIPEFVPVTKNILIQSRRPWRAGDEIDFPGKKTDWTPALPDAEGVQNWKGVFAAFQKQDYDGLVTVIENSWPYERRQDVARRCAEILPRLWREAKDL